MTEQAVSIEKLVGELEKFNIEFPRPGIGKLELSEPVDVTDQSTSWPHCTFPGVYILLNKNSEVLYVGKASCNTNLGYRLGAHFYANGTPKSDWLEGVTHVRTIPVDKNHSFEAPAIEEYLIQQLNPPLNVSGRRS